jgi:hypothetical protein
VRQDLQGGSELRQDGDGRITHAALHTTDVGAVDLGLERQGLLRQPALWACPPWAATRSSRALAS